MRLLKTTWPQQSQTLNPDPGFLRGETKKLIFLPRSPPLLTVKGLRAPCWRSCIPLLQAVCLSCFLRPFPSGEVWGLSEPLFCDLWMAGTFPGWSNSVKILVLDLEGSSVSSKAISVLHRFPLTSDLTTNRQSEDKEPVTLASYL